MNDSEAKPTPTDKKDIACATKDKAKEKEKPVAFDVNFLSTIPDPTGWEVVCETKPDLAGVKCTVYKLSETKYVTICQ